MLEELKALLIMFSHDLHELEERFPDEDLPEVIDNMWMDLTFFLEDNK